MFSKTEYRNRRRDGLSGQEKPVTRVFTPGPVPQHTVAIGTRFISINRRAARKKVPNDPDNTKKRKVRK